MDELIAELVIAIIVYICKTVYSIVTNAFTRVGNVIRRLFGVRPLDA
jgi:CBS domain containing-hemolysin-like protein